MTTLTGKAWDVETGATQEGVTVNVGELLSISADEMVFAGVAGDSVTDGKNVVLHISAGYRGWFSLTDATEAKPPSAGQDPALPAPQGEAPAAPAPAPEPANHWWDK